MNKNNRRQVGDFHGKMIQVGSIVCPHGYQNGWTGYQGLVVEPDFLSPQYGHITAVFFNLEVAGSVFLEPQLRGCVPVLEWDEEYGALCRRQQTDFLFENDSWKKSPRIVFFKSTELEVENEWSVQTLTRRLFSNAFYAYYTPVHKKPVNSYMCRIQDCENFANRMSFFNLNGLVHIFHTCENCFQKINGSFGEELPLLKETVLLGHNELVHV